jgi:hypothetical protein
MDNDYFFYYDMINIYSAAMILASEVWSAILSILYLFIYLFIYLFVVVCCHVDCG